MYNIEHAFMYIYLCTYSMLSSDAKYRYKHYDSACRNFQRIPWDFWKKALRKFKTCSNVFVFGIVNKDSTPALEKDRNDAVSTWTRHRVRVPVIGHKDMEKNWYSVYLNTWHRVRVPVIGHEYFCIIIQHVDLYFRSNNQILNDINSLYPSPIIFSFKCSMT